MLANLIDDMLVKERKTFEVETAKPLYESVMGAWWHVHEVSDRDVLTVQQRHELPEIIARILVRRGIALDQVPQFLEPTLRAWLPDPFHLIDMDKAAARVADAIMNNETIGVLGDYDVDGATSTSVLLRYFQMLNVKGLYYIPDRIAEGYGPNKQAMDYMVKHQASVCITVDCGTLAFEPIAYAKSIGLDVVVIDHHLGAEQLPDALAIVNPNRLDETSEHGYMAAVGVAFLLIVAVNRLLTDRGYFTTHPTVDLLSLLDIVALGTVCDVVPLKRANRAFVAQGLKILRRRNNIGLSALADVASINEAPGVYHLGFVLGPRINAGGRVGKSDLGTRLLTTSDADEAILLARELDKFNAERKNIEQFVLDEAMQQAAMQNDTPLIMVAGEGWHPGVIGIVAGRIKERFHRPTAVISLDKGVGKASARSIHGVDFGSAIVAANQAGLLLAGGGHAMAAGFSVEQHKKDDLHEFLSKQFLAGVKSHGQRRLYAEGFLSVGAITNDLISQLTMVGPFGAGNAEPCFILPNVCVRKVDVLSGQHLRVIISDSPVTPKTPTIKAMAFRCVDTPLGQTLLQSAGKTIQLACKLRINTWQGVSNPEILIEDVAL